MGGVTRKRVSSVNNMLPGSEGTNPPVAVASRLWSCCITSRLCSWKRRELTVVQQNRRQRVTSEPTCVKNSGPKCCVCCQRPPMAHPSTVRATQVSCHTDENTCVCAMFRQDTLRSERTQTVLLDLKRPQMTGPWTLRCIASVSCFPSGVLIMRTCWSFEGETYV